MARKIIIILEQALIFRYVKNKVKNQCDSKQQKNRWRTHIGKYQKKKLTAHKYREKKIFKLSEQKNVN